MTTVARTQTSIPASSVTPRSWSFVDRRTGESMAVTCMPGCTRDHSSEAGTEMRPENVFCWSESQDATLPVNANGEPEEFRVLSTVLKMEPWSDTIAQRLPYASVELVDDYWIENLDPDGLETVINTLASQLDRMRATHRRLVETRADHMQRHTA